MVKSLVYSAVVFTVGVFVARFVPGHMDIISAAHILLTILALSVVVNMLYIAKITFFAVGGFGRHNHFSTCATEPKI